LKRFKSSSWEGARDLFGEGTMEALGGSTKKFTFLGSAGGGKKEAAF
jgi:hypothetical protein